MKVNGVRYWRAEDVPEIFDNGELFVNNIALKGTHETANAKLIIDNKNIKSAANNIDIVEINGSTQPQGEDEETLPFVPSQEGNRKSKLKEMSEKLNKMNND